MARDQLEWWPSFYRDYKTGQKRKENKKKTVVSAKQLVFLTVDQCLWFLEGCAEPKGKVSRFQNRYYIERPG